MFETYNDVQDQSSTPVMHSPDPQTIMVRSIQELIEQQCDICFCFLAELHVQYARSANNYIMMYALNGM